jgi:hypothetical protein
MRKPATQRGALTPRRQWSSGCNCRGEARPLPTRLQRAQFLLPPRSHDDLRENQRRLSPSALHTVSPPSTKLLHTHGHHQSTPPGIQTTPRLVLILQSRRTRPRVRPGHRNEDRHRPHKRPRKKTPHHVPTPSTFTSLHTPTSTIKNTRHLDDNTVYHSIL